MLLTANSPTMVSYAKPARVLGETALILSEGSALVKACWLGRLRLVRLLVEGGTEVNNRTEEGRTALMASCMTTYRDTQTTPKIKMVKYLLEHKADPNIQDKYGKTALMYACIENAEVELVTLLLEYEADPRMTDHTGSSALVYAINTGNSSILTLLIEACKTQGWEVLIVTTKHIGQGLRARETRQHLGVPPVLPGSPPFYQCITPSDIEFKTSLKGADVKKELTQDEENIAAPFQIAVPQLPKRQSVSAPQIVSSASTPNDTSIELDCWNRVSSRETSPNVSPKQSPAHSGGSSPQLGKAPKELTPDQSSLYKRRLNTRDSNSNNGAQEKVPSLGLELLHVSAPNSPTENDDDQAERLYIEAPPQRTTPILNISAPEANHESTTSPLIRSRKPLIRRQSAEIIRFRSMLQNIHENSGLSSSLPLRVRRLPLSEGCSPEESMAASPVATPLHEETDDVDVKLPPIDGASNQLVSSYPRRNKSLPKKPPPLRKSQTCHVIKCPLDLIGNTDQNTPAKGCPDDLDAQSPRSDSAIENSSGQHRLSLVNGVHSPRGSPSPSNRKDPRKRRMLQRRGSMPHLLNDKLSRKRPGTLPPLKVNPHPPIPSIGSRFDSPPVLRRQTSDVSNVTVAKAAAVQPLNAAEASTDFDRRRMSMQVEDMQKVMDSMKDVVLKDSVKNITSNTDNDYMDKAPIQNNVLNNNLNVKKNLNMTKSL